MSKYCISFIFTWQENSCEVHNALIKKRKSQHAVEICISSPCWSVGVVTFHIKCELEESMCHVVEGHLQ